MTKALHMEELDMERVAAMLNAAAALSAVAQSLLARFDLESADAIFPGAALREDLRAALTAYLHAALGDTPH